MDTKTCTILSHGKTQIETATRPHFRATKIAIHKKITGFGDDGGSPELTLAVGTMCLHPLGREASPGVTTGLCFLLPCIYPEKWKHVHTKAYAHIDSSVAHSSRKWTRLRCPLAVEGVDKTWSVLSPQTSEMPVRTATCMNLEVAGEGSQTRDRVAGSRSCNTARTRQCRGRGRSEVA